MPYGYAESAGNAANEYGFLVHPGNILYISSTIQMADVHRSTTDSRHLVLSRHARSNMGPPAGFTGTPVI